MEKNRFINAKKQRKYNFLEKFTKDLDEKKIDNSSRNKNKPKENFQYEINLDSMKKETKGEILKKNIGLFHLKKINYLIRDFLALSKIHLLL